MNPNNFNLSYQANNSATINNNSNNQNNIIDIITQQVTNNIPYFIL